MLESASLVAHLVKNLPAVRETWVQSPGLEDPLAKGKATLSSIFAWRIPCIHGVAKSDTTEQLALGLIRPHRDAGRGRGSSLVHAVALELHLGHRGHADPGTGVGASWRGFGCALALGLLTDCHK